jgi:UDP-4-amino-4,6-dideoxy-N-acetyl-beta-L-altrosamine transaminase
MIPYSRQYIDEDDIKAVTDVLRSDWITQGPKIAEFEEKVAEYCGARYAVAVSSGTAALHLACLAAGVGEGDEVITSPITFVASANCALYVGAIPVFADIRPDTYCIDTDEIRKKITDKTKVIIPVDFAGHPCDMDDINKIAKDNGLIVIEDAAHSLGAEYKGKRVGSLADMTILSFHPVKHITTGEGGMVVTDNEEYYEKLTLLRSHGITRNPAKFGSAVETQNSKLKTQNCYPDWYYEMQELGFNYRITDFQCALGISQMKKLETFVTRRTEIARRYGEAFRKIEEIIIPEELACCKSSYHLYPIQLKTLDRDQVFAGLREKGIGVNVHYIPVHLQPYYRKAFGYKEGDFPIAEEYFMNCISLPIHQGMTGEEIEYVITAVSEGVKV